MSLQTASDLKQVVAQPAAWDVLRFGKHKGKTLPQVLFADPNWFFWAKQEDVFHDEMTIAQADQLSRLATRIKIPDNEDRRRLVEYAFNFDCKHLDYVKPVEAVALEGHRKLRERYFDLSWPHRHKLFGKKNGLVVVKAVKRYVIKDADASMTKRRCAQFFEDMSNFDLSGEDPKMM